MCGLQAGHDVVELPGDGEFVAQLTHVALKLGYLAITFAKLFVRLKGFRHIATRQKLPRWRHDRRSRRDMCA
jgi:hypothetical protein